MKMKGTEPYLPPPPPPPPPPSSNRSKLLIVVIIIALVVVVSIGAYIALASQENKTGNGGPSFTPSPSASLSPTPTSSATVTPSPSASYVGYRVGAWVNYSRTDFHENGETNARYNIMYHVDEGSSKGVNCWLLQTSLEFSAEGSTTKTLTTYWLDKSSLEGLHYKIEIYSGTELISVTENDYSPGDVNDIPTAINPSVVIGQETITVPAGMFTCDKVATTTRDLGNTYVTTVWGNQDIPVVGMVKQEMTRNGFLISLTELTAYGG